MRKPKIGFLPLYIKLYDDCGTDRAPMVKYMNTMISMLETEGIEVVAADVCRIKPEFEAAVKLFKDNDVDAVATWHLAYSPSLESIDALCSLEVPLVVLDTTPTWDLENRQEFEDCIGPNHGIHGVQDMCCMLRSRGKAYTIVAGHALHTDIIAQAAGLFRAAAAAKSYKAARVGIVGGAFEGMGDFSITPENYKSRIGAEVVAMTAEEGKCYSAKVTDDEIEAEIAKDGKLFINEVTNQENYKAATRAGLAIRKWIADKKLTALTVNFLKSDEAGLAKMPFLELSKEMMAGVGYAGEGDTLTAGMVGALLSVYPDVTFTEMFCPDWEKNIILLSHMGEMNLHLVESNAVLGDKPFSYNASGNTVSANGCLKAGKAVLVNLAPQGEGFRMNVVPVDMLDLYRPYGIYRNTMAGWLKPPMALTEFLPKYSVSGGTHHSALVYGVKAEEIAAFGKFMGFEVEIIK